MALVLLLLGASGCKHRNARAFWRNAAKETCKWSRDCESEAYRNTYSGLRDCRLDDHDRNSDPDEFADSCGDYDQDVGKSCLAWLQAQRKSCTLPTGTPGACEGICGPGSSISFSATRTAEHEPTERFREMICTDRLDEMWGEQDEPVERPEGSDAGHGSDELDDTLDPREEERDVWDDQFDEWDDETDIEL